LERVAFAIGIKSIAGTEKEEIIMEVNNIPGTFWNSLSVCMLAATFGLLFIAIRSGSVSIKVANAEIQMEKVASTTEQLSSVAQSVEELQSELETKRQSLASAADDLSAAYKGLGSAANSKSAPLTAIETEKLRASLIKPLPSRAELTIAPERIQSVKRQLESIQKTLPKLQPSR
jgi:Asp-tRNA(Asn)/Glu-tRNA(Gln) amidotransferase C subunit